MLNSQLEQTLLIQRCSPLDRSLGRVMKTLTAFSIALFFGIAGCVIQRAQIASRAQTELVGMSKKDLLSCAGVPLRQERVEELEFLTFAGGGDSIGSAVASSTSSNTATVVGKSAHRYCEATFVLKNGLVQKVNYQGRTGGLHTKGEQCAFIVENCVR